MAQKSINQGKYSDDDMDMELDVEIDQGEKGGQATRDQSDKLEKDDRNDFMDEELDSDFGSDF